MQPQKYVLLIPSLSDWFINMKQHFLLVLDVQLLNGKSECGKKAG